jgi:hypothetical protein
LGTGSTLSGGLKLGTSTNVSQVPQASAGASLAGTKTGLTGLSGVGGAPTANGTAGLGSKVTFKQLENLVNKVNWWECWVTCSPHSCEGSLCHSDA